MDEQRDELRDALTGAVPPLPAGLQARAVAAMAAASPRARNGRSRLLPIAVGVVAMLLTLGLDPFTPLRHPPVLQGPPMGEASAAAEAPPAQPQASDEEQSPEEKAVAPYRQRAAEFVRARYPKDADMLMAAGLLTTDPKTSLDLLKQSLSIKSSSAAWGAYVGRLVENGPRFARAGEAGGDPADPESRAATADYLQQVALPDRLSETEVAPILAAIRDWRRADPQNSVPVMYEARYLYALHRDADALVQWREAGRQPHFGVGYWDQTVAVARLLSRMGMDQYTAITNSFVANDSYQRFAFARSCSRFATYEGRLAQLEGRPQDAVAWWNATMQVGRHAAESADTLIQVLVGIAVEGIGASYVWKWHMVTANGEVVGPIMGGRIYEGSAYAFYVSHAGQKAADDVRDSLLKGKLRSMLTRDHSAQWQMVPHWTWALSNVAVPGALAGVLCVAFLALGTWRRREADEATHLGRGLRLLIVVASLLPGLAGALLVNLMEHLLPNEAGALLANLVGRLSESGGAYDMDRAFVAALVLTVALSLLLPFIAAWASRRPSGRVIAAWRGNLRQTLPVAVATCGALALCFGITGKVMQTTWTRQWYSGRQSEMRRVIQAIGPEWDHPRVPPDAWRAEPVPEPQQ